MVKRWLWVVLFCVFSHAAFAGQGGVVASIKPLHSLVAAVMEGDEQKPLLLVDGKASMHGFSLKPSQRRALEEADLVFYISPELESFVAKALYQSSGKTRQSRLSEVEGLTLYPVRWPHHHDEDEHEHEDEHGEESGDDMHVWMSPENAKLMVAEIARRLSEAYPQKQALYERNAKALFARLDALDQAMAARMAKIAHKPFVVFHDAYQYFEKRYGLQLAGAINLHPEDSPSAQHVRELRQMIVQKQVKCVFREPQFEGRLVDNLVEGTPASSAMLDPEGALLEPGPELYFQLIESVAAGLEKCLA